MYQLKSMKIYPEVLRGFVAVCFPSKPVCIGTGRSFTTETHGFQEVSVLGGFQLSVIV